jgi:predicted dehydrogenase
VHAITQSPNDTIRLGVIGFGTQGLTDANAALRVPNVQVVAAASCYDGHLERARELLGDGSLRTRDYRRILDRKDIDAVVVATPDHWHMRACLDALDAGKDVYCEKPLTHTIDEGTTLVNAVKKSTRILQVGSQHTSSPPLIEAKQLIKDGVLGQVTQLEASWNTNNEISSWLAPIPPDASPSTIDWPRWLGSAPRVPFDADRHFQWRIFREYGEGLSGDVLVHIITALHFILDLDVPEVGNAVGGRFIWKGKRNVYDAITGSWEYPEGIISILGATEHVVRRHADPHHGQQGDHGAHVDRLQDLRRRERAQLAVHDQRVAQGGARSVLAVEGAADRAGPAPDRIESPACADADPRVAAAGRNRRGSRGICSTCRPPAVAQTPVQDVIMGNNAAITAHMANLAHYGKQTVRFDRATRSRPPACRAMARGRACVCRGSGCGMIDRRTFLELRWRRSRGQSRCRLCTGAHASTGQIRLGLAGRARGLRWRAWPAASPPARCARSPTRMGAGRARSR